MGAIGGFDDVAEILLQRGAQTINTSKSPHGDTRSADDLARGFGNHELADKLSKAMKDSAARLEDESPAVGQLQRMNLKRSEAHGGGLRPRSAFKKSTSPASAKKTGSTSE